MARIKYYDPGTNEWKYADSNLTIESPAPDYGGKVDYTDLENKPKINGVELIGDKSLKDLGIGQPTETTPTYKNFKAGFLGDSQTAVNVCKNKIWWQWVVELLGITNYVNYGQNGATLSTLGKTATPICERCETMDSDVSMIFVMGGVNEFRADTQTPFGTIADTTPSTIYGAVRYICQKLQAKYPRTPIIFITPTNQKSWTHKDGHSMADLAKAITDACRMEGVLCLDAQGSLGINPAYDNSYDYDGLHLNDLGSELLGKWVANQVKQHIPILSDSSGGDDSEGDDSGETEVTTRDVYVSLADYSYTEDKFISETGAEATYAGVMYSEKIPVPANTEITYMNDSLINPVFYDADKNFISAERTTGHVEGSPTESTTTTPANCAYVVIHMTKKAGVDKYYIKWKESGKPLTSISATYSGGDVTVGTAVADLTGIVVTAHYTDGTSANVFGYTLSGTIAEGSNTVTVSYGGKTTTFSVTGVSESGGEESPEGGNVIYTLSEPMSFNGTSDYVDTGIKLFDTPKDFTIVMSADLTKNTSGLHPAFYCAIEESPYPGLALQCLGITWSVITNTSRSDFAYVSNLSQNIEAIAIVVKQGVVDKVKYIENSVVVTPTLNPGGEYIAIGSTLVIGARKQLSGTPDNFFTGDIYTFDVYDYAMEDTDVDEKLLATVG